MKRLTLILIAFVAFHSVFFTQKAKADEGMWVLGHIPEKTDSLLHELGLELTDEELYSEDGPSLNNAIVMFGGFCSGVVVSPDGLVFTNHHCGYESIQGHSSVKNDYLKNGFFAKTYADELPNDELYVAFHLKTVDVTEQIIGMMDDEWSNEQREAYIDSISNSLTQLVNYSAKGIYSEVNPFYKGSKYYLSVYQRYDDVRLVFAPPSCLGKFGGDTDNWMWPRQTCDFSVFRVYADRNNQPAEYSKDNVPYHPQAYAHVSTQGVKDGDYSMTLGYPGGTDRYLSSYGIWNTMRTQNDIRYSVRTIKLDVLNEAMKSSDALRIMYASKYAHSSNYWKFSLGQNQALDNLKVMDEKRALENEFNQWAAADSVKHGRYIGVLDTLKCRYEEAFNANRDYTLWEESFYGGSDIFAFALKSMMGVMRGNSGDDFQERAVKAYKDIDVETDKRMFKALIANYMKEASFLPDSSRWSVAETNARIDSLYEKSVFARPDEIVKATSLSEVAYDPMLDFVMFAFDLMRASVGDPSFDLVLSTYERLLGEGIREMNHDKDYYPDANFTLRMSYGLCKPIIFAPGTTGLKEEATAMVTTPQSFLNKYTLGQNSSDANVKSDYELIPPVLKWMKSGKFSKRYIDPETGKLPLCFLTTNDITGGNSGSGMFDGKGRLIGLAFDGNWEAMSGDIKFDNNLQRCIGVDIRWVLSVIEDYSHAKRLINELTIE